MGERIIVSTAYKELFGRLSVTFRGFASIHWSRDPMPDVIINRAKVQCKNGTGHLEATQPPAAELHPAWLAVIRFCREMGYGEISCLKIHGGLPISAEVVTKKIRWY